MPARKSNLKTVPAPTDVPEILPAPLADSVIEEVYGQIRTVQRNTAFEGALKIGEIIVNGIYAGDVAAWRHRGQKDASFRKLAERFEDEDGLGISAPALYRAAALYELEQRIGVSALKHLTATHCYAVLGLPDHTQQKLLTEANEKELSTRQLEEKAKQAREKEKPGDGRGRPPLPAFVKTIHRFAKWVDDGSQAFNDLDQVEKLDQEEAEKLHQAVLGMKLKCEEVQKALERKIAPPK